MKKINSIFILLLTFQPGYGQRPDVKIWDYRYGGADIDVAWYIIQTHDSGYVLSGYSESGMTGDKTEASRGLYDYWMVKTDRNGNKLWDKRFGGGGYEYLHKCIQTTDKGFLLGGHSNSNVNGDVTQPCVGYSDLWIVKTDSLGNKLWDKRYGGTQFDGLYDVILTSDGGYIFGGPSYSGAGGDKSQGNWDPTLNTTDYWVMKTDSLGNMQWEKTFGGLFTDELNAIVETSDNGFLLCGKSNSGIGGDKSDSGYGGYDFWVVKINSSGVMQWNKSFGGSSEDNPMSMVRMSDNNFLLAGYSSSGISGNKTQPSQGMADCWLVKIDPLGNIIWDRTFGGSVNEFGAYNIAIADKGYLLSYVSESGISGDKSEANLGPRQPWIMKIDTAGNKLWDKTVTTSGYEESCRALQTIDGCYAIVSPSGAGVGGYKSQLSQGVLDYWVVKLCDSTLLAGVNNLPEEENIFLYPNPVQNFLQVFLRDENGNNVSYEISDIQGRLVLSGELENNLINVERIVAGSYFAKLKLKGGEVTKMFIKAE